MGCKDEHALDRKAMEAMSYTEWFLLMQIKRNIQLDLFEDLIKRMYRRSKTSCAKEETFVRLEQDFVMISATPKASPVTPRRIRPGSGKQHTIIRLEEDFARLTRTPDASPTMKRKI